MKKNKGFTLVEVIVILVILAILAAVLIPSLTTYIDKAKEKSITANARAAYVATQALLSEAYGLNDAVLSVDGTNVKADTTVAFTFANIYELAQLDTPASGEGITVFTLKSTSAGADNGVIGTFEYTEDGKTAVHNDNGAWTVKDAA